MNKYIKSKPPNRLTIDFVPFLFHFRLTYRHRFSSAISSVLPQGNILVGVAAYCIGMAVFTMIMGNAFGAFSVITLGIGIPFVFSQGANPAIAGALALTAGYCGTLMTPMGANFNVMPAALLEIEDKNAIKA